MPNWNTEIRQRLAGLRLAPHREHAIIEELSQDLDDCYADWLARGVTETEAYQNTLAELHDHEFLRRELQRVEPYTEPLLPGTNRKDNMIADLWQDLRFGARMLRKYPGFTLTAMLTLALCIGANTAIFSVVYAALLRPLPYAEPERIVAIGSLKTGANKPGMNAPADFLDWKQASQTMQAMTAMTGSPVSFQRSDQIESLPGAAVSEDFLAVFGVAPLLGRAWTSDDFAGVTEAPILLSHAAWQEKFGGDPNVLNQTLLFKQESYRIIGVMPPEFRYPRWAKAWQPLARNNGQWPLRGNRYFDVVGRIKPNTTIASAEQELQAIAARLAEQHPKNNRGWTIKMLSLREWQFGDTRGALWLLFGAVALVLLIGCANVANLLLVRISARRHEIIVRLALGAGHGRVLRQLLAESLLLALGGGLVGVGLAVWGIQGLLALLPDGNALKLPEEIRVDGAALSFTFLVSVVSGVLFGLVPGWLATRAELASELKEGGRSVEGGAQGRLRNVLIVGEVALALLLLVGAGLLLQSLRNRVQDNPGYEAARLMTWGVSAPLPFNAPAEQKILFYQQALERVANTPGVESVALTNGNQFGYLAFPFNRVDEPLPQGDASVRYSSVSPNYFSALGVPLRSGRAFTTLDTTQTPHVFVINEALAKQYFGGANPVGRQISLSYLNSRLTGEVVGVVGNVRQDEPGKPTLPEIYASFAQVPWFSHFLVIRSRNADPRSIRKDVEQAIRAVDPQQTLQQPDIVAEQMSSAVAEPRLYAVLLGAFAAVALVLAALGLYGVMAFAVQQRRREIGVRIALGAQASDVMKLVLKQGAMLTLLGIALGLVGALGLTRLMTALLFGVRANDPLTFAVISLLLTAVALLACYIPARRATKVDPMIALRSE
jgi:putative ABC transport system permease protein